MQWIIPFKGVLALYVLIHGKGNYYLTFLDLAKITDPKISYECGCWLCELHAKLRKESMKKK